MKSLEMFKKFVIEERGNGFAAWDRLSEDHKNELEKEFPYCFPVLDMHNVRGGRPFVLSQYEHRVRLMTKQYLSSIRWDNMEGIHIDHILPVRWGYLFGVNVAYMSSPDNLQVMIARKNIIKKDTLTEEGIHLLKKWKYGVPKGLCGKKAEEILDNNAMWVYDKRLCGLNDLVIRCLKHQWDPIDKYVARFPYYKPDANYMYEKEVGCKRRRNVITNYGEE